MEDIDKPEGYSVSNPDTGEVTFHSVGEPVPAASPVRSAVEREGGIRWVDAYLDSESAFRAPIEPGMLEPATPRRTNRAQRREDRRSRR